MRRILLPFLLTTLPASAQRSNPPHITFDLIGVNEGLPHALVECFLKDDRGNLWVGMQQGLAVYDGSAFVPVDLEGDAAPIGVRAMARDAQGIIWVASEQGPVRVDPVARKATLVPFPDSLRQGIETLWFHAVAVTKPGEILFGTNSGTFLLDVQAGRFTALRNASGELVRTFWRFFCADSARQGVWISTHQWGLAFYHWPTGKLYERDGDSSVSPLIGLPVVSLCPDGNGGFWCSDRSTGMIRHWDGRSDSVRSWDHVPGAPELKVTRTWFMGRDRQGRIWGSANRPGGFRFDPKDSTAVAFAADDGSPGALPYGSINDIYEGADGEIWIANALGIAIYDPALPQPHVFEPVDPQGRRCTSRIWALEFSGDSLLWCAMGDDGLVRIDLRSGSTINIPLPGRDRFVWDVLSRGEDLIVACADDVFVLDVRTTRIERLELHDGTGASIEPGRRWLANDIDGSVWMSLDLIKLVRFDVGTGEAVVHIPDSLLPGALRFDNSYAGVSMPDGRLWIGGNLSGLAYFDPKPGTWTSLIADVRARRVRVGRLVALAKGSDRLLWIASDGAGLIRYDIPTGTYTHYDQRHGITELGLLAVAVDARGRVWTGSDERIFCFDPQKERAVVVDPRSSTGGDAAKWTIGMSRTGRISFNIGREVAVFDANAVGSDRIPPAPVLSQLLVDGEAMDLGADGSITMRHDNAQLEVDFGAVLPPGTISAYAMRVPGEPWSEYKEGRVNLRGLRPGEHLFEFRLMNEEGAWGPATTLRVVIPPPWWQTLVARILFALALAGAIVLFFRLRLNAIRRRERKEEGFARTMNELKLRALRAQMDPHFIFNCLNSIDKYILMEQGEKASHYLNRFARLVRLILNQSDSVRVPLEKEAEMLRYYLELEAQRFKKPFAWEVRVDPDLLPAELELPTMLVQPYVENAIWHGLQHKPEAGSLLVHFRRLGDDLECTIEDDGIGREASARINAERGRIHQSKSMQVNADRMKLFAETHTSGVVSEIIDLKDTAGNACGTRVRLVLPIDELDDEHQTERTHAESTDHR